MTTNALFFGWNRSIPGREKLSAAHFQEFAQYLSGLQQSGGMHLESFGAVRAVTGEAVNERMALWTSQIPE